MDLFPRGIRSDHVTTVGDHPAVWRPVRSGIEGAAGDELHRLYTVDPDGVEVVPSQIATLDLVAVEILAVRREHHHGAIGR